MLEKRHGALYALLYEYIHALPCPAMPIASGTFTVRRVHAGFFPLEFSSHPGYSARPPARFNCTGIVEQGPVRGIISYLTSPSWILCLSIVTPCCTSVDRTLFLALPCPIHLLAGWPALLLYLADVLHNQAPSHSPLLLTIPDLESVAREYYCRPPSLVLCLRRLYPGGIAAQQISAASLYLDENRVTQKASPRRPCSCSRSLIQCNWKTSTPGPSDYDIRF